MVEIVSMKVLRKNTAKYTRVGEFLITKYKKPYLKMVITAAEEEKPTVNMIEEGKCSMPGCEYECDSSGLCLKHQRSS